MAKKKVVVSTTSTRKAAPTASRSRKTASASSRKVSEPLLFDRTNYFMMLGGIGLIMLGLLLMSGGAMPSPDVWDESIIYSGRRTVLAPMVILAGIVVNMVAIFKKPKTEEDAQPLADL